MREHAGVVSAVGVSGRALHQEAEVACHEREFHGGKRCATQKGLWQTVAQGEFFELDVRGIVDELFGVAFLRFIESDGGVIGLRAHGDVVHRSVFFYAGNDHVEVFHAVDFLVFAAIGRAL